MTTFIIAAAVLIATALILVVPPLLGRGGTRQAELERRELNLSIHRDALAELEQQHEQGIIDDGEYEQARLELEQRLLEEVDEETEAGQHGQARSLRRGVAIATIVFIPMLTILVYTRLGSPEAFDPSLARASEQTSVAGLPMSDRINAMVARLASRLEENPDDAEGWMMLGRSYIVLQRFSDARAALEKAAALKKDDPQLLADLADALAMTSQESLAGRPSELIAEALRLDPDNQKALWLAGTAAYERADYAQALRYWRKLYKKLPPGSETAKTMQANIAEAEALLEGREPPSVSSALAEAPSAAADAPAASGEARLTGRVRLADSLKGRASADDTVFIFAKAASGPPMPLAVQRARVGDLPLDFVLDESMAMTPQMSLARFPEVIVVARISKSGNAMPRSGDLQGRSGLVAVGGRVPEIVIDEVVP